VKLQQLPEADADALLRFLRVLNPRNLVTGNVVSFHKQRAFRLVWLLRTPRSDGTGPPLKR
jgi:hypothetical protein